MAPRAPGVHTHEEWKGMAQPVGLVVEPVVLNRLGVFPESATTVLADWQQRLEQLLEDQPVGEQWLSVAPSFELFCQEVLAWQPGDLRKPEELAAEVAVHLDDYDEVLRPDWVVGEPSQGDGPLKAQLLMQELPLGTPFDALPKGADGRRSWEATPQQRLERLLKESEHPIGLLWNGMALRMVYAPRGESSGHLTFPLEPMTTVDGRPMLAALQMLLGPDRLFEGGASNTRLRPLMEQSRKEQNEVSTRLAEQVLEALWILLRGFDAAGLQVEDPSHIYGGLITVLLRLVFLLYAEDEELMPTDSLYGQHYSVGGLAQRLRQDRTDYQNAMEGRRGAWATLLSLFRLVYDGGGSTEAYLPARHGDLFDPETYPFLEGRTTDTSYTDGPLTSVPAISDDVVEQVLTKLLLLDGQILSYRALDVEQIGSVYEGIMGFMVEKATGPRVGITYRPPRQKITITVVVHAEELLAQAAAKRANWLDELAGVKLKLSAPIVRAVKEARSQEDLAAAMGNRLSTHTPRVLPTGSLILQPTQERRRSGSHYTPRALTEPIVAEALRPWLERCNGKPTAEQVLALKLCDPAMGSGAFLVALCRYLARWLVAAWEDPEGPGFPQEFRKEWDKDLYARRLIAQRCIYGVDKNPFAVNLAKLSLWLVTLSKDLPFTFVDHALKCGDSLVGYSVREIRAAMSQVQLGFLDNQNRLYEQMGIDRRESFAFDSLTDEGYERKKVLLQEQIKASEGLRQVGDLMVAAFFDAPRARDRADKQQVYLAMLSGAFHDDALNKSVQEIRTRLGAGEKGITPFHWDLEFPEVFSHEQGGFDVFVGNPPFISSTNMHAMLGENYKLCLETLRVNSSGRAVDLCAHFFRLAFEKLGIGGVLALLATNTICQGDTREAGLEYIVNAGGCIYNALKRFKWPGVAAVVTSYACIVRPRKQDRDKYFKFNSYLLPADREIPVKTLANSTGHCFIGHQVYGAGFVFEDDYAVNEACHVSPGELSALIGKYIKPYLGAKELLESPREKHRRYIIDVNTLDEASLTALPAIEKLLRERVKPERDLLGGYSVAERRKQLWWKYGTYAASLQQQLENASFCIVIPRVSSNLSISIQDPSQIFADSTCVIPSHSFQLFSIVQSQIHHAWCIFRGSSMKDDLRYTPTDCFETFPFPAALLDANANDPTHDDVRQTLEAIGERYHQFRSELMVGNNEGLTSTYNHFHDPAVTSRELHELRRLHGEMDQAVLQSYGWSDLDTSCGFGLDYLDTEDDAQLPDELQERIESGELFFWEAGDALDFQGLLQANGAITGRRKLPWRYRWPDAVRDDVLARLLALNADRYAEEQALGSQRSRARQRPSRTQQTATESASAFPISSDVQVELFNPQIEQLELGR